jgi:hypothetical protein
MPEVITVHNCELDIRDLDYGTSSWIVSATIADIQLVRPAVMHPADIATPEEYGPANCSATFDLDEVSGDEQPPNDPVALRQYIQDMNLDWHIDEED